MQKNRKLLASLCISALSAGFVNAGGTLGGDSASYSPHNSVSMGFFMSSIPSGTADSTKKSGSFTKKFDYVNKGDKQGKGLLGKDLEIVFFLLSVDASPPSSILSSSSDDLLVFCTSFTSSS